MRYRYVGRNEMQLRSFVTLALVCGATYGSAQGLNVAIVAAASSSTTAGQFTDPQSKLMGTGRFNSVSIINASLTTPTLADLQQYHSVMVWSNVNFQDSVALGNVLADYVDAGGGVVVAIFANTTTTANRWLGGRWVNGYEVIPSRGGTTSGTAASLGNILVPGHPLMNGVNTFHGGTSSFRPTNTTVTAGSTKIAQWSDGRTLVAVGSTHRRVDLGMYPPSAHVSAGWWDPNTDGAILMANALEYAAVPEPATMLALLGGAAAVAFRRRKHR
jgi:hypothetical protein